ncbi:MAG: hypothetical protein IJ207_00450 [Treponema sp.]|uniref:hypothetical protein n=1 Tax=Treponema sp. TaxID=166 RepID=UPI0025D90171|nr:hypothetical protein [Treponema sp.]MBQ9280655.1 hypothetical protein [Treponema sp.]
MKKIIVLSMSLMALLFGFVSCSNDDNDDATETKDSKTSVSFDNLEALDISDAKALYIGTGTTGSNRSARDAASESIQKLLKITDSDKTEEVAYLDKDGFMLYTGRGDSGFYTRVKKTTGSLVPMTYTYAFWTGLDGYMYYCEYDSSDKVSIKKIDTTNYEVNIKDYATNLPLDFFLEYPYDAYKLTLKNKMYFIRGTSILEVHNESNTPRVVTLAEINAASVSHVVATENYYYLAGTDTAGKGFLVKVDPTNDTCTNLLSEDYVMYTFTASEVDGIVFNAMRMSDGKKIIGKVGVNGGAVTIIDEESDAQITYLERIN